MANNEYINKVEYGDQTLMDITDTTAESGDVIEGQVFYAKNGARSVGTLGDATTSTHGLMSATDKSKLDNIESSANNYVLPAATQTVLGGVKVNSNYGIKIEDDTLKIIQPVDAQIRAGLGTYTFITAAKQHISTFFGLAKAAGDTSLISSANAVGTYTEEAKAAIQSMLGITTSLATTSAMGYMSAADKQALEEWKSLRLSVDAQGYVCQTVEVNE